ncbi:MAG: ABC transporter permease [Phycisphaerales bacterium]
MISMILRRLLVLPFILLVIYTITFLLSWSLPGEAAISDERRPPEALVAAINARYNLDSAPRFYGRYLYNVSGLHWTVDRITGAEDPQQRFFDLGPSLRNENWTVNEIIADSLPVSIVLGLSAIFIAVVIGLSAGVIGAVKPNSLADLSTLVIALVGISLPSFVIGTVLLIIFPVWLGVGSVGRWGSISDIFLPAFSLSLPFAAYIARLTRMGMIDVLNADYIRTAMAKGVSRRQVILKHALKNAFLPVLSYLGPATAFAMTGSFVVERVFNIPGMGQHFVDAVQGKDLFVIMGVTMVFATILILLNLVVDVLYRWVDPRIT